MTDRRTFLSHTAALAGMFAGLPAPRTILLRSSWQTVNIGDIGHTPGVLRLIADHIPGVDVRLWPSDVGHGVEALLRRRFPRLGFVRTPEEVEAAFRECDFLLHGSGPSLVGRADVRRWSQETGKPYGVYGITFPGVYGTPEEMSRANPADVEILSKARFAFFRDSVSLAFAKDHGVASPVMAFAPDGLTSVGGYPGDDQKGAAAFRTVDGKKMTEDFVAAALWLKKRPDSKGKLGAVGFCFGGGMVNQLAVRLGKDLNAGVAFYGRQAGIADVPKIEAPLLFNYAGNDQNVNGGIAAYEAALKANNKKFETFTYEGKQHGFHNDTTPRYDAEAAKLAWERTLEFFKKNLK